MKTRVTVATWFYYDQPGFLDFRYRIEALSKTHDVTLVLRDVCFQKEFDGIPVTYLVLPSPGRGKKPLLKFIWQLAQQVKATEPDLLVLLGSQLALASLLLQKTAKILYWNEHPTHFFAGHNKQSVRMLIGRSLVWLSFYAARQTNVVMPIGEAHRDDLLAHGVPASQLRMNYMGVADRFATLGASRISAKNPTVLSVVYTGTVQQERGRDVMLEGMAMARARGIPCHLTIVGAMGDEMDVCKRRIDELGLGDAVQLVGRVPGADIPGYLQRADFGVCIWADRVWWRYNPPTKLFEYLVSGLPVLGSRIRTHTEYVRDGENGFVFDYDAKAFAEVLERTWEARVRWPAMSTQAATEGQRRYLWSSLESQFLKTVTGLLPTHDANNSVSKK